MATYNVDKLDTLPSLSDTHSLFFPYEDTLPSLSDTYALSSFYEDTLPSLYDFKVLPPINTPQSILVNLFATAEITRELKSTDITEVLFLGSEFSYEQCFNILSFLNIYGDASQISQNRLVDVISFLVNLNTFAYAGFNPLNVLNFLSLNDRADLNVFVSNTESFALSSKSFPNIASNISTLLTLFSDAFYITHTTQTPISDIESILAGLNTSAGIGSNFNIISNFSLNAFLNASLNTKALSKLSSLFGNSAIVSVLDVFSGHWRYFVETSYMHITNTYSFEVILDEFPVAVDTKEIYNLNALLTFFIVARTTIRPDLQIDFTLNTNAKLNLYANQLLQSIPEFVSQFRPVLLSQVKNTLFLYDNYKMLFPVGIDTIVNFYDRVLYFVVHFLTSYLHYADTIQTNIRVLLTDILDLIGILKREAHTQESLTAILSFWDFLAEILKNYGIYIYFNFYAPEKFTFLQTDKLNAGNVIFLQDDGIYTIDTEEYIGDNNIILDLSQLQVKNVKRIDKIYYSHQPEEIIIVADGDEHYPEVKETFTQVPKGLRAKDYKVILSGLEELEYLTLFMYPEFRSKK